MTGGSTPRSRRRCQWPRVAPTDRDECDRPALPGRSYCCAHQARAYLPPEKQPTEEEVLG